MPTIHLHLGSQALTIVKKSHYNLCLAKIVEADGRDAKENVFAIQSKNLLSQTTIQWEEEYKSETRWEDEHKPDASVNVNSSVIDALEGETTMVDNDVNTHSGAPFEVADNMLFMAHANPIRKYSIFWTRELETSTMYESTSTPSFEFDMTGDNEVHLEYTATGDWVVKSKN